MGCNSTSEVQHDDIPGRKRRETSRTLRKREKKNLDRIIKRINKTTFHEEISIIKL